MKSEVKVFSYTEHPVRRRPKAMSIEKELVLNDIIIQKKQSKGSQSWPNEMHELDASIDNDSSLSG